MATNIFHPDNDFFPSLNIYRNIFLQRLFLFGFKTDVLNYGQIAKFVKGYYSCLNCQPLMLYVTNGCRRDLNFSTKNPQILWSLKKDCRFAQRLRMWLTHCLWVTGCLPAVVMANGDMQHCTVLAFLTTQDFWMYLSKLQNVFLQIGWRWYATLSCPPPQDFVKVFQTECQGPWHVKTKFKNFRTFKIWLQRSTSKKPLMTLLLGFSILSIQAAPRRSKKSKAIF